MKTLRRIAVIPVLLVLAGCVSAPKPEKSSEPRKKERIETVRVPVLTKETSFFANGVLDRTITYTYDPDNRLLLERTVREPSRSEPTERTVHAYKDGKLVSAAILDYEGKPKSRTDYTLDAAGNVAQETVTDSKGAVQTSSRYEYGADGLRTVRKVYDASGVLLAVSEYAYAAGRLSVVTMKDAAERPAGRITHEYSADGLLVTRTSFDPSGAVTSRERFAYKGSVLAEERTERGDGRLERRIVYEIGPENAPVKSTLYDGSGRVRDMRTYEHTFRNEERTVVYYD